MKASTTTLALTAAALLAVSGVVVAQQGPGGGHGDGFFGGHGGHGGHGGQHVLRLLHRVGDRIGLTDAQKDQIQAIVDAGKPELDALHDQAAAAGELFRETHEIGDFDATAFRTHFESQADLHVEMKLIGAEMVSQVWAVLTPEQQTEVLEIMELFRDGRGGPRHGGGKRYGGGN